jgi:hypothetical protein
MITHTGQRTRWDTTLFTCSERNRSVKVTVAIFERMHHHRRSIMPEDAEVVRSVT